jgi:hypothetical protein
MAYSPCFRFRIAATAVPDGTDNDGQREARTDPGHGDKE